MITRQWCPRVHKGLSSINMGNQRRERRKNLDLRENLMDFPAWRSNDLLKVTEKATKQGPYENILGICLHSLDSSIGCQFCLHLLVTDDDRNKHQHWSEVYTHLLPLPTFLPPTVSLSLCQKHLSLVTQQFLAPSLLTDWMQDLKERSKSSLTSRCWVWPMPVCWLWQKRWMACRAGLGDVERSDFGLGYFKFGLSVRNLCEADKRCGLERSTWHVDCI